VSKPAPNALPPDRIREGVATIFWKALLDLMSSEFNRSLTSLQSALSKNSLPEARYYQGRADAIKIIMEYPDKLLKSELDEERSERV